MRVLFQILYIVYFVRPPTTSIHPRLVRLARQFALLRLMIIEFMRLHSHPPLPPPPHMEIIIIRDKGEPNKSTHDTQ